MATVYDHGCLVTTLKNLSGKVMRFGFLPPHGMQLGNNETINVVGNILEAVNRGDRFGNRFMNGLLDALDAGLMEIVSTPLAIGWDAENEVSKVIGVDDDAVLLSEPCWETSLSET